MWRATTAIAPLVSCSHLTGTDCATVRLCLWDDADAVAVANARPEGQAGPDGNGNGIMVMVMERTGTGTVRTPAVPGIAR